MSWQELSHLDCSARFTIADAGLLLDRARQPALRGWGIGRQRLPRLT